MEWNPEKCWVEPMLAAIFERNLRPIGLMLILPALAFVGCQSVTRNQQAWQFPVTAEMPIVAETKPPPQSGMDLLPKQVAKFELDPAKPVPKVFSLEANAKKDTALIQTTAQVSTLSQPDTVAASAAQLTNTQSKTKSETPVIALPPLPTPAPADPSATRVIVEKLVSGSNQLSKSLIDQPEGDIEILPEAEKNPKPLAIVKNTTKADANVALASGPVEPALPLLKPEEPRPNAEFGAIRIPRAAVCSAVRGLGNFVAMPEEKIVPGATILVYWEIEGLGRAKPAEMVKMSATVELIRAEGDQIIASSRETMEKIAAVSDEADFATLKWQIPPEVSPGNYRVRIITTDLSSQKRADNEVELTILANSSR
jgi:hypothetical protein